MAIRPLNTEEHRNVLKRLFGLAQTVDIIHPHSAGMEYTSLMVSFLKHNITAADCVLRLYDLYGDDYFPATVGYTIVRTMFEIDVTAHYISRDRSVRANQYIEFGSVLKKQRMDACGKHRNSKNPNWREAMEEAWRHDFEPTQKEINSKYDAVCSIFMSHNKKGQAVKNWSGKTIRQMAVEVDHEESYDLFYADLSSFTHADVRLADRFLRLNTEGISWSSRPRDSDIGGVFRYADIFLNCYLLFFGREFNAWPENSVEKCWY